MPETSVGIRSLVGEELVERPARTRDETESSNRARADCKRRKSKRNRLLKTKMQTGEQTAAALSC